MHYREAIKTAIEACISDLFDEPDVGWRSRESRWRAAQNVQLLERSNLSRGRDERRHAAIDGDDDNVSETVTGNRRLVILVTATSETDGLETDGQETDGTPNAQEMIEHIRLRLQGSDVEGTLALGNLGAPFFLASPVDLSYTDENNGEQICCWGLEVAFPTARSVTIPTIPKIKRVVAHGVIKDETGADAATIDVDTNPDP